jgi:hypothetical protein
MSPLEHSPVHRAGKRMRHALMWGGVALLATGLGWLALHTWWPQQGPVGPQPHPGAAWLLRAHGALAWGLAALGGAVWQGHVRPAWRVEKRRWLHHRRLHGGDVRALPGIVSALGIVVLLATAIGLQYAPDEAHAALSRVHWLLGVAMAAAMVVHRIVRHRRPVRA